MASSAHPWTFLIARAGHHDFEETFGFSDKDVAVVIDSHGLDEVVVAELAEAV